MGDAWDWVAAAAVTGAMLIGVPYLLRGGRAASTRPASRRVRAGPGLPGLVGAGLARRLDTVVLAVATAAFLVLIVANARAA